MYEETPLLKLLLNALDEIQATDIVTLNVREQTSVTDFMVICTGRASRHVKAIAEAVLDALKKEGYTALSVTGIAEGEWALIDFGDVVLHVMQPESRAFYNLEGLWEN